MTKAAFLLISFFSSISFGDTLSCKVVGDSTFRGEQDYVLITHNAKQIETIAYLKTESKQTTTIYSRTLANSFIRGGYDVSYCNPDSNEVSDYKMSIDSLCVVKDSSDQINFYFRLDRKAKVGKYSYSMSATNPLEKTILYTDCQ